MKKIIALLLSCSLLLTACAQNQIPENTTALRGQDAAAGEPAQEEAVTELTDAGLPDEEIPDPTPYHYEINFESLNDEDLMRYMEDDLYLGIVGALDSDEYVVEEIRTVYVSQEYIDELAYNSQANIYFGYTLEELDAAFEGTRYVFTLGEEGDTIVTEFEEYVDIDICEKMIRDVAIGTGVILVCVTVSFVSAGLGAPAVSMIFAMAAETGTKLALSYGGMSAIAAGIATGIQTHDMNEALQAAALAGSEGFKWGAITGSISGGASEYSLLRQGTQAGLKMNEVARIQQESKFPIEVIAQFRTMEEYEAFKAVGLKSAMINNRIALVRTDIDLDLLDDYGRTNLERMRQGLAPLDSSGKSFELHHIGQEGDASLAILTQVEHDNPAYHISGYEPDIPVGHGTAWTKQRQQFWKAFANWLESGGI
ncbi:MAG: HNH/ENDO VII family nuclease [Clostridium sp.]|nr:HNH/ENDO VII family nuclease [Clostridium sp.]